MAGTTPTQGKFGPSKVFFYCDGFNLLLQKVKQLSHKIEALTEATDGLGDASEQHTPIGKARLTLTQSGGFYDTTATTGPHAALAASVPSSAQAATRVMVAGFAGDVIGQPFVGFEGAFTMAYETQAELGALTKANATHVITGQKDAGVILQHATAKTADWNTKSLGTYIDYTLDPSQRVIPITSNTMANPTVVTTTVPHGLTTGDIIYISGVSTSSPTINGERTVTVISTTTFSVPVNTSAGAAGTGGSFVRSNSSGGGVGYQQVLDCSGFTNFVGKIRDSADDSTYADLITFTDNVVDPYAERLTVSGTVDRYLCFDGNITGSGSITVWAGFARS